jgi:hypothetical protein
MSADLMGAGIGVAGESGEHRFGWKFIRPWPLFKVLYPSPQWLRSVVAELMTYIPHPRSRPIDIFSRQMPAFSDLAAQSFFGMITPS